MMNRRSAMLSLGASSLAVLGACAPMRAPDLVEIAAGDPQFSTLVAAVEAAGLAETLQSDGPFTLFAPVNAAFDALPSGTVASLLRPENRARLASILTYHVLPAQVTSANLIGQRQDVATVQGQTVHVDGRGRTVRVNRARVLQADILASNGVIHVIDRVLLPS